MQQETQLSQRDRAMLRVIEYFAKSLKIIENGTIFESLGKSYSPSMELWLYLV